MRKVHFLQRGFAAIAAIFLVVILAALGAFMLTFSNTQQLTSAQDLQGTRAYWAAQGGLEWAIGGVVATTVPTPPSTVPLPATCPTSAPPATIDGFNLTIACTPLTFSEAGTNDVRIFQLRSVAWSGTVGSINFVERSVSATMER